MLQYELIVIDLFSHACSLTQSATEVSTEASFDAETSFCGILCCILLSLLDQLTTDMACSQMRQHGAATYATCLTAELADCQACVYAYWSYSR